MDISVKNDFTQRIEECNKMFLSKMKPKNHRKTLSCKSKSKHSYDDSDSGKKEVIIDNMFRQFRTVLAKVTNVSGTSEKTTIFRNTFTKGSDGCGFKGDTLLWCNLLLPSVSKRNYKIESSHIIKIFSEIFGVKEQKIIDDLDHTDIGLTIQNHFENCARFKPAKKSTLTIYDVDKFLNELTKISTYGEQYKHFERFAAICTGNDLKVVIRLINQDLRMDASVKHVLEGLHPDAYQLYMSCKDLKTVIEHCCCKKYEVKPQKRSPEKAIDSPPEKVVVKEIENVSVPENVSNNKEEGKSLHTTPTYFFNNVKLLLDMGVIREHSMWIRQFIACGGTVLKPDDFEDATHVLHLVDTVSEPSIQAPCSARHVILEWIIDSISKQELQDFRPYTVRWNPKCKFS